MAHLKSIAHWPSAALTWLLVGFIRLYQRFISPLTGPSCRYYPTCSAYAVKSLQVHGPVKGLLLGSWRILRCNPFTKGGIDPVPSKGHWHPSVDRTGKPLHEALLVAESDTAVTSGLAIGNNGAVDTTSTSTKPGTTTPGYARPTDPAPLAEQVTAPDLSTDGLAPSGPGQETT